jgi:hypothetical protein
MEGGDDLSAWPRARLKRLCCDAGLNEDGTKKELVKRLRNASDVLSTIKQREPHIPRTSLRCWLQMALT